MAANLDQANDRLGMWSPVTSHIDWCEENYHVTFYVAEFWNTITNICLILNGIIGLIQTSKDQSERRFFNFYLAQLVVGIGSWGFHMTLRHTLQMADEIPMLWLVAVGIYIMLEINAPPKTTNVAVAVFLFITTVAASTATALFSKPIYFQITFGIYLVTFLALSTHTAITKDCNPRYLKLAVFWLAIAFTVWTVDTNYCPELRTVRHMLPWPSQHLLQLHAWWHVFSNFSIAFNVIFMYDTRSRYLRHKTRSKLQWGLFPYMEVTVARKDVTMMTENHNAPWFTTQN